MVFCFQIHSTTYVKAAGESGVIHLNKDERRLLCDGDEFRLLPNAFCYQLCLPKTPITTDIKHGTDCPSGSKSELTSCDDIMARDREAGQLPPDGESAESSQSAGAAAAGCSVAVATTAAGSGCRSAQQDAATSPVDARAPGPATTVGQSDQTASGPDCGGLKPQTGAEERPESHSANGAANRTAPTLNSGLMQVLGKR